MIPHNKYLGGAEPFAFTETGVAMLSSVLKSKAAVAMNIAIVRAFIVLRRVATEYRETMEILNDLIKNYDGQFNKFNMPWRRLSTRQLNHTGELVSEEKVKRNYKFCLS